LKSVNNLKFYRGVSILNGSHCM